MEDDIRRASRKKSLAKQVIQRQRRTQEKRELEENSPKIIRRIAGPDQSSIFKS